MPSSLEQDGRRSARQPPGGILFYLDILKGSSNVFGLSHCAAVHADFALHVVTDNNASDLSFPKHLYRDFSGFLFSQR